MPIIAAALLNMIIGFIWYSPYVFGKQWMKLIDKKHLEIEKKHMLKAYTTSFIMSIILSFVLSQFIHGNHMDTLLQGAKVGFWVWLGFVVTTSLPDYLFTGRRLQLYILNNGFNLIAIVSMGALLAVWH